MLEVTSFVAILGGSMVFMLLPWTAINLAHSSATAGIVMAISNIPGLVLSPVMGSFIDKIGRHRAAVLLQLAPIITSLAFPFANSFGAMTIATLLLLAVLRGLLGNGSMSARKALLPDSVAGTKITLERANSLHESIAAGGFAIGPALASVLIGSLGTYNTFYVVAGMELLAALLTLLVKVVERHDAHEADDESRHWIHYLLTGFKTIGQVPSVLILFTTFAVLATVYLPTEVVVLPNYYASVHDPETLGFLLFDMAIFTMLGSLAFEWLSNRFSFANIMRWSILTVALAMLPMCLLPNAWVMFIAGAVLGLGWGPLPPLINTVIQRKIPASQRGRVFSVEMTIWTGGPMISMGLVGWGVDSVGVRVMYPAIAIAVVVAAVIVSTRKSVRDLNTADYTDATEQ
jgi:MFS family permease